MIRLYNHCIPFTFVSYILLNHYESHEIHPLIFVPLNAMKMSARLRKGLIQVSLLSSLAVNTKSGTTSPLSPALRNIHSIPWEAQSTNILNSDVS